MLEALESRTLLSGTISAEFAWVDNTDTLDGYTTADLVVTTSNDWTGAALLIELTQGSIYQDANGMNVGPLTGLFDTYPTLEFDTYLEANGSNVNIAGGAGDVGGDAQQFDTVEIDITWFNSTNNDTGTFNIGRFTLSDDAVGTWSLKVLNSAGDSYIVNNTAFTNGELAEAPEPEPEPGSVDGDFTGDGNADILWRNIQNGKNYIWEMNGTDFVSEIELPRVKSSNWRIVSADDFTGDGKMDVFWHNIKNGKNIIWEMDGTTLVQATQTQRLNNLKWTFAGAGDFTGDGKTDLFWRHAKNGKNSIWQLDDTTFVGVTALPGFSNTKWQSAGVADMTGDGKADILWRNQKNGRNKLWEMNGTERQNTINIQRVANNDWQVAALYDYTGDGERDILWRNTSNGKNTLWQMDGPVYLSNINMANEDDNSLQPASPPLGLWEA